MIASDSLEGVIDGTKRVQVPPSLMNLDLGGNRLGSVWEGREGAGEAKGPR